MLAILAQIKSTLLKLPDLEYSASNNYPHYLLLFLEYYLNFKTKSMGLLRKIDFKKYNETN
jgi:hypothetical protein